MSGWELFSLLVFLASGMSPDWVGCQLTHTEPLFPGMHICCLVFPASFPLSFHALSHSLSTNLEVRSTLAWAPPSLPGHSD